MNKSDDIKILQIPQIKTTFKYLFDLTNLYTSYKHFINSNTK